MPKVPFHAMRAITEMLARGYNPEIEKLPTPQEWYDSIVGKSLLERIKQLFKIR